MGTIESSYKSLLQGVSQQIATERLDGQVGSQENMLSDPVTNLRRRPGAQYAFDRVSTGATYENIKAWFTDISGFRVHIILNITSGEVVIVDPNHNELAVLEGAPYLITDNAENIQAATVGDEFFMLNRSVLPVTAVTGTEADPVRNGFFFIVSGAFSRKYEVTLQTNVGTISASYTTPSGSSVGDAALTTPEHIATQLVTALTPSLATAGVDALYIDDAYVYVLGDVLVTNMNVSSSTGSAYIMPSRTRYTNVAGNLPAQLPAQADGFIMAVGDTRSPQYYKYKHADRSWLESGAYGSPSSIENMPISITNNGVIWGFNEALHEGRFAGDDTNNPDPRFLTSGITGIGSYQGRLVLLAGSRVNLSASGNPRRFYRSTVTTVLDSDPIEVGSSANSSADYKYAIPFQKDLLLFSSSYQALIPTGNQALTPRTATVLLTSTHDTDTSSPPITIGRTLMYPVPRSKDFFGVMEMVPSPYTDSQYLSMDSTPHLPKYMGGRCRFSVASSVANMALFSPTGDPNSLLVHEYQWDGDTKAQSAWHRWTFPYPIATAYFASELIYLLFAANDVLVAATIDPRVGVLTFESERRPFLDLHSSVNIVDNLVDIPPWLVGLDPGVAGSVGASAVAGDVAGDAVGFSVLDANTLQTVRSWTTGLVGIGLPYRSSVSPTRPVIKDSNEVAIHTTKQTLLRYAIGTKNSAEYTVNVQDRGNLAPGTDISTSTLSWDSAELELGRSKFASEAINIVPCRTHSDSTVVEIFTEGTGELNITSLEYVLKYNQKIKRR